MTNEQAIETLKTSLYKPSAVSAGDVLEAMSKAITALSNKSRKSKILDLPRASGKTRECIKRSETQNIPILCIDKSHAKVIQSKALAMEANIPQPITIEQLGSETPDSVIVDELPLVFKKLLELQCGKKVNVELMTLTSND